MMNWLFTSSRTPPFRQEHQDDQATALVKHHRDLAESRGLVDLVDLIPFDVQIVLTDNQGIQMFEVTDIVTAWMNESFEQQLVDLGYENDKRYAEFDSVILLDRDAAKRRKLSDDASWLGLSEFATSTQDATAKTVRLLQDNDNNVEQTAPNEKNPAVLYTARFEGVALFTRDDKRPFQVPVGDVLEMQRNAIHSHDQDLWKALTDSNAQGLGSAVAAVNAYLNPIRGGSFGSSSGGGDGKDEQLQLVIVVAVCVACVAFLFLVMAMVWAWRYDRQNRAAYLRENSGKDHRENSDGQPDPTGSETTYDESPDKSSPTGSHPRGSHHGSNSNNSNSNRPPFEVYGGDVYGSNRMNGGRGGGAGGDLDEDISTSLSQYYRSGMGSTSSVAFHKSHSAMGDNVSVSSMESYGYSLDGYAPTISTPMPSDIPRSREAIGGLATGTDDERSEREEDEEVSGPSDELPAAGDV